MYRIISFIGLFVLLFIAWLLSEKKRLVKWRVVVWGTGLQLIFAVIILKTAIGRIIFDLARIAVDKIVSFSDQGAAFLFGKLVNDYQIGAIVAFKVLPIIIFVSSLTGILYYFGIIQVIVNQVARVMHKTMKISGAEAVAAAMFIFMGIECITALRGYLERMTKSELFTLMTAFMATIASSVMATYASFGADPGHLLAASIMSAPAAIVIAKLMVPETDQPETIGTVKFNVERTESNVIEAAANGASTGLNLALQISAMLIAFVGIIWMLNSLFRLFGTSFDNLVGYIFAPLSFLMGVPWEESVTVGKLLGTKTVFNEFIAYLKLQELIQSGSLSPRAVTIAIYALCGFANFGSIAILIGGIGGLVPSRKKEVARLGFKALISGSLASFVTATIAGLLI